MNKIICLSFYLVYLVETEASSTSIIAILTMVSCKGTCKGGTCKQQIGTAFPNLVKCECTEGWTGEWCDVLTSLSTLKTFRLPPIYSGAATEADLALIDTRVANRDSLCANNFVCRNGGYCAGDSHRGYRCKCTAPYTGIFCTELCEKKCLNGGECFREAKLIGGSISTNKVCKCPRQYQGEFCEIKLTR